MQPYDEAHEVLEAAPAEQRLVVDIGVRMFVLLMTVVIGFACIMH